MSTRKLGGLLALLLANQGCMMQKVEDLADRYIPDANPEAPTVRICEAQPTRRLELSGNLSRSSLPAPAWDTRLAPESASFRIDCTLYGEQLNPVAVTLYFAAHGGGVWDYHVLPAEASSTAMELGSGQLRYDAEGALASMQVLSPLRLPRPNGALGASVELWLGTPKSESSDGLDGMISTDAPSATASLEQDGHPAYRDVACPESGAHD